MPHCNVCNSEYHLGACQDCGEPLIDEAIEHQMQRRIIELEAENIRLRRDREQQRMFLAEIRRKIDMAVERW